MNRRSLFAGMISLAVFLLTTVLVSPLLALCLSTRLSDHVYDEISFQYVADTQLPPDQPLFTAAMDYTRRQLWLIDNTEPYSAKPFQYLVNGVGWCDYVAKVFCRLMASRGIHARYVFLKDKNGVSPHTIAEVYLDGKWRPIDPFNQLVFMDERGVWPTLEEITPAFVEKLPQIIALRQTTSESDDAFLNVIRYVLPLRQAPQRSEDFLQEKHLFDQVADFYVRTFGRRFVEWYQDQYLKTRFASIPDPTERLWQRARHYHLYGRFRLAEACYREMLSQGPSPKYRERTVLFLSKALIHQGRFAESRELLQRFAQNRPNTRWAYYHMALCDHELGDAAQELQDLQSYQKLKGSKYALEAMKRLRCLSSAKLASAR